MNIIPKFIYGTAWKEEKTKELTLTAINAGFNAIDTANQRKHYFETGVGEAIAASGKSRQSLFLQTKFTFRGGQDHRLPYDAAAPTGIQVQQSFESSLQHLGTTYVDSYVLHGPSVRYGLSDNDWEAWASMEKLFDAGKTKSLGISNVGLDQLALLYKTARIKPLFVQNRCFASTAWDRDIRNFCLEHGIHYQGFSLLTANGRELDSPECYKIAEKYGKTLAQVVFRFAMQSGMIPLAGTSKSLHMQQDLQCDSFTLNEQECQLLENISQENHSRHM